MSRSRRIPVQTDTLRDRRGRSRYTASPRCRCGARLSRWVDDRQWIAERGEARSACHRTHGGQGLHDARRHRAHEGAMPRKGRGPHLWLHPERRDAAGRITHTAIWYIKDGGRRQSTQRPQHDLAGAERALQLYLDRKHQAGARRASRDPAEIAVADVLAFYAEHVASRHARPKETLAHIRRPERFFGDNMLADINGDLCRAFVAARKTAAGAREDLAVLRAAINFNRAEGGCDRIVSVTLPDKGAPRERWLTRSEAAALIWHAWRYREVQKGQATDRRSRRHVARFILVALYTGTRAGAVCAPRSSASPAPATSTSTRASSTGVPQGPERRRNAGRLCTCRHALWRICGAGNAADSAFALNGTESRCATSTRLSGATRAIVACPTLHRIRCATPRRLGRCRPARTSGRRRVPRHDCRAARAHLRPSSPRPSQECGRSLRPAAATPARTKRARDFFATVMAEQIVI